MVAQEKLKDNQIIPLILLGSPSIINTVQEKINNIYALDYVILQAKHYIYTKKSNNNSNFDFYAFLPIFKKKDPTGIHNTIQQQSKSQKRKT
jgi:hypothetical protein